MSRRTRNRSTRSTLTTAVVLLIAATAVALIGVSPIALGAFHGPTDKWERFSFIGQTYGAASAIVSVLALVGIVMTLSYQARETKLAREETRRQAVSDLLKMAMEDPDLDECWGPVPGPRSRTRGLAHAHHPVEPRPFGGEGRRPGPGPGDVRRRREVRNVCATATAPAGRPEEAVRLHEACVAACERALGPDHPTTLLTRLNHAYCAELAGDAAAAVRLNEELLPDR